MKFLVITDIHGNVEALDKIDSRFKEADAVLFAGDFCECFKTETSKPVLDALVKKHDEIYAVLGNCDEPDFIEKMEDAGINAERVLNYTGGIAIVGSGGGSKFTGKTPNERDEDDLIADFRILEQKEFDDDYSNVILISHNPPKAEKVDSFAPGMHAGSQAFCDLIVQKQPLAVVTGHIHEGCGIEKIGETTVINSGSLGERGTYCMLEVEKNGGRWTVKSAEIFNS
ncbi:MAG: metallophosphoesterase family protein [Treponema sp.]|nr:metallophosphoesterase family protein [Treponema sp.]